MVVALHLLPDHSAVTCPRKSILQASFSRSSFLALDIGDDIFAQDVRPLSLPPHDEASTPRSPQSGVAPSHPAFEFIRAVQDFRVNLAR